MSVKLSTSQLAKKREIQARDLFNQFRDIGFIVRDNDAWILTETGKITGGEYKQSTKFGQYIVWPEDIVIQQFDSKGNKLSATLLGDRLGLSSQKTNQLLNELGWINKALKGWKVSNAGMRIGGVQHEDSRSGVPFVLRDESILQNKIE